MAGKQFLLGSSQGRTLQDRTTAAEQLYRPLPCSCLRIEQLLLVATGYATVTSCISNPLGVPRGTALAACKQLKPSS
jgi:hypothetical protein